MRKKNKSPSPWCPGGGPRRKDDQRSTKRQFFQGTTTKQAWINPGHFAGHPKLKTAPSRHGNHSGALHKKKQKKISKSRKKRKFQRRNTKQKNFC